MTNADEYGKVDSTPEWVVDHRRTNVALSGPWETLHLNRKEDRAVGKNPMTPRSLKACVSVYTRLCFHDSRYHEYRIRNITTKETLPIEFFL